MALLWCDGFDHYGTGATGRTNMLAGVWAALSTNLTPSATQARTGSNSLSHSGNSSTQARRVFPGATRATVGFGAGIYLSSLPSTSNGVVLAEFRDSGNAAQICVKLSTTGQVVVLRGNVSGAVLGTSDPVITAQAWHHYEIKALCADSGGAVEVRVNGVTVLDISGVDTRNSATSLIDQVAFGSENAIPLTYWDDVFAWDTAGSLVNDFIGPQRVYTRLPDADTAESDWTRNTGSTDFSTIDQAAPDGDTTYIAAATVGDISEFGLTGLPAEVSVVTALYAAPMSRKEDAGAANLRASLVSGASVAAGADRPITEAYTYWDDVFETDPATGAPWTPAAANAALLRLEKTA